MKLTGKIAIITGAAGGIGAATARLLAQEGARLCISDMDDVHLAKVAEEIQGTGADIIYTKTNVANAESVQAMVDATINKFGRIDILINNAGIIRDTMSWKMTDEQWDLVIDVNLKGTFNCCRAVLPIMRNQNSGKIVNTSSISARGNPGQANYSAAKAGIIALTQTLALEAAKNGININCIAPGFVDTQMTRSMPAGVFQRALEKVPLRRMGQPEEVAKLHLFLVSDDSSFITGQTIYIDGGISVGNGR